MTDQRAQYLISMAERAISQRSSYSEHWNAIARVVSPSGDIFTQGQPNESRRKDNPEILDSTGIKANELLAAGFFSLLTSPSTPWFALKTEDTFLNDQFEVQQWLTEVAKIMAYEIQRPQSGFTTAMHEDYMEYGAYGNCICYVTANDSFDGLLFQSIPLAESYFMENDAGRIDTLIRRYWRTGTQLVERFGEDAVGSYILAEAANPTSTKKFEILHIIMPNKWRNPVGWTAQDLPFASFYVDKESGQILSFSGYEEQPFMAARFYRMPQEIYGRGPGSLALADLNMLQRLMETTLRAAQKVVDPPLQMPDNGFINPPRTAPGAVNYYNADSEGRMEPLLTGGRIEVGLEMIQDNRNRIREVFFVDQLQLNVGPQMTATEVLQRTEEKQRLMGPVTGRAGAELLSPLIMRSFGLLARMGKLPPPPSIMLESDAGLKIVYISPIMKAQEQVQANNLMRATEVLTPLIAGDPQALTIIKTDQVTRDTFEMFSLPGTWLHTEEELAEIREAQAEQATQATMTEDIKNLGLGVNNLAGAAQKLGNNA